MSPPPAPPPFPIGAGAPGGPLVGPGPAHSPYGDPTQASTDQWWQPVDEPGSSLRERACSCWWRSLAGVVLGVVGGYLWSVIADPPVGILTDRGVFLTDELAYNQQVVVTLWFLVLGAGLGLIGGFVLGLRGRRHGVAVVVAVLVLTAIAAAVSAYLGIHVFGPDPGEPGRLECRRRSDHGWLST